LHHDERFNEAVLMLFSSSYLAGNFWLQMPGIAVQSFVGKA
jgi:hypothetical protein